MLPPILYLLCLSFSYMDTLDFNYVVSLFSRSFVFTVGGIILAEILFY